MTLEPGGFLRFPALQLSASLIGFLGSSTFRLSASAMFDHVYSRSAMLIHWSAVAYALGLSPHIEIFGGGCSPDRTGLHLKFPASREFSREFFEKRASDDNSRI